MFKFLKDRKKKDNKGFTLVELVIVIAILAILVGLLAPQYTKYVEKSRKTADASNMDEMVKVVKVYAADPANELPAGTYKIVISNEKSKGTDITAAALENSSITKPSEEAVNNLKKEMKDSIPNWDKTVTKSKKWAAGAPGAIEADVTVNENGGTSVTYPQTDTFKTYMAESGSATGTATTGGGTTGGGTTGGGTTGENTTGQQ